MFRVDDEIALPADEPVHVVGFQPPGGREQRESLGVAGTAGSGKFHWLRSTKMTSTAPTIA